MTKRLTVFTLTAFLVATAANAADMDLGFDGTSNGGWSLVNGANGTAAFDLTPSPDFSNTGLDGLTFNDMTGGVMYYAAPASLLSQNFTDVHMNFNYQVNSSHASGPFQYPLNGFSEVYINGNSISGIDVIDESIVDTLQSVTIDFGDPAFNSIDLNNVESLWIKAEWWGDDVNPSTESHLITAGDPRPAPEPDSGILLIGGLFAAAALIRTR